MWTGATARARVRSGAHAADSHLRRLHSTQLQAVADLESAAEALLGLPASHAQVTQLLRYHNGEEYKVHTGASCARARARSCSAPA